MKKNIVGLDLEEQQFVSGGTMAGQGYGYGKGPGGFCVCPKCGEKVEHQRGVPCLSINCTKCEMPMVRE